MASRGGSDQVGALTRCVICTIDFAYTCGPAHPAVLTASPQQQQQQQVSEPGMSAVACISKHWPSQAPLQDTTAFQALQCTLHPSGRSPCRHVGAPPRPSSPYRVHIVLSHEGRQTLPRQPTQHATSPTCVTVCLPWNCYHCCACTRL